MKQLVLPVTPGDRATFDNFVSGENAVAVAALQALVTTGAEPQILLVASAQRGKSHLLRAACELASTLQRSAHYVSLREASHAGARVLHGLDEFDLLCIDDIHHVVCDPAWAESLFHLINARRDADRVLVLASQTHPAGEPIPLPDLKSRLLWGPVFRLQALGDEDLLALIRARATSRGFEIPLDAAQYLLSHCPRETGTLLGIVDSLDTETLIQQRKVTVPFIKAVLGG